MRSTARLRECHFCGRPTRFEMDLAGPRGGKTATVPACPECGEQPARRAELAKEQAAAAA